MLEVFSSPTSNSHFLQRIDFPKLKLQFSDIEFSPLTWQIICGPSQHLVSTSEVLSPEYRWKWTHFFLARKDNWSQPTLEREIGASTQPDLGSQLNQYTLVSLDSKGPFHVVLAPRYLIWTPVALLTLLLATFAVNYQIFLRPAAWCLFLPAVLGVAAWSLDLTVLVVQSLLVAICIILIYAATRWILDRGARRKSVFAGRGMSASLFPSHRHDSRSDQRGETPSGSGIKSVATTVAQQSPARTPGD